VDREAKASVKFRPALADASEIIGLPRDNFEVREISKREYEEHYAR
jgi:hypothetical protein